MLNHFSMPAISPKLLPVKLRYRFRNFMVDHAPAAAVNALDRRLGLFFPRYFDDTGVVFVHVPKAAGTSIADSLYGRSINHLTADYYARANPAKFRDYYSFAVVRNPFERLVSAYLYARKGGTERVPIENPFLYSGSEFDDFTTFFYEWLVRQNEVDFVFKPQHQFVCDESGQILVDDIFDLSELDVCEEKLSYITKRNIRFSRLNESRREPVDYGRFYANPGLVKDVYIYYRADYELLGKAHLWRFPGKDFPGKESDL